MRIEVDRDICQGHAECAFEAPAVFSVPKGGQVQVADDPPESERARVAAAVRFCPTQALRLVD